MESKQGRKDVFDQVETNFSKIVTDSKDEMIKILRRYDLEKSSFIKKQSSFLRVEEIRLQHKMDRFNNKLAKLNEEKTPYADSNLVEKEFVSLNLDGGHIQSFNRKALCSIKGTHLERMFSGRFKELIPTEDNSYNLDINITIFNNYIAPFILYESNHSIRSTGVLSKINDEEYKHRVRLEFKILGIYPEVRRLNISSKSFRTYTNCNDIKFLKFNSYEDVIFTSMSNKIIHYDLLHSEIKKISETEEIDEIMLLNNNFGSYDTIISSGPKLVLYKDGEYYKTNNRFFVCYVTCMIEIKNGIVIGSMIDNSIKLWDNYGNPKITLTGHKEVVTALCQFNDSFFLSGSGDGIIKMWDSNWYNCISTIEGHSEPIRILLSIGENVVSVSDSAIKLWEPFKGTLISTIECIDQRIHLLCVFDDQHLVGSVGDRLLMWNILSCECIEEIEPPFYINSMIVFQNKIVCASYNGTIEIFEVEQ